MIRIMMIQLQIICLLSSLFVIAEIASAEVNTDQSIDSYSFHVKIENIDIIDIVSVRGLGIEMALIENQSKNSPLIELSPSSIKIKKIILRKKFSPNSFFNEWAEKALAGKSDQYMKTISITVLGYLSKEDNFYIIQRWTLSECFPVVWELSPLRTDNNTDLFESLVVACNGLKEESQL